MAIINQKHDFTIDIPNILILHILSSECGYDSILLPVGTKLQFDGNYSIANYNDILIKILCYI